MSASTYPIADLNPIGISVQQRRGTLTVYNPSVSNTVYLNEYPNASAGFPLGPGSTLTWDESKDLYAYILDVSKPVTITVVDNGGTLTDAKAIADQILAAGLATDIAQDIAIHGAPPIDVNAGIYSAVTTTYPWSSSDIDVSQYQSVLVGFYETPPAPGTVPTPRHATLQFIDVAGIIMRGTFSMWYSDTNAVFFGGLAVFSTARVPVLAPTLRLILETTANTHATGVFVIGSYKTVAESAFSLRSAYFASQGIGDAVYGDSLSLDGLQAWNVPNKAAGLRTNYPSHVAGDAVFSVDADTVTVAGNVRLVDTVTPGITYATFALTVSAAYQRATIPVVLPNRPVSMLMDAALAGTNITATLAYKVR